jgi:hypothetical protein
MMEDVSASLLSCACWQPEVNDVKINELKIIHVNRLGTAVCGGEAGSILDVGAIFFTTIPRRKRVILPRLYEYRRKHLHPLRKR